VISSWRAFGDAPDEPQQVIRPMEALGQRPLSAPSPKGWPEDAAQWAAPAEILKRINLAQTLVAQAPPALEPGAVAAEALGPMQGEKLATALARAESRPQALAVLLMSPEFQRR
jgi:uncharacterized protein (DUF1800 family)